MVREEQPWFFYEKADTPSVGMKAKSKAISWVIASKGMSAVSASELGRHSKECFGNSFLWLMFDF